MNKFRKKVNSLPFETEQESERERERNSEGEREKFKQRTKMKKRKVIIMTVFDFYSFYKFIKRMYYTD